MLEALQVDGNLYVSFGEVITFEEQWFILSFCECVSEAITEV